jgi:choline transport protein
MLTFVFNALFGLLYLGPSVAFSAYVASCTIFLNVSYVFPVITLLIRGRQVLKTFQTEKTSFALGSTSGLALNWISAIFVVVTSVVGTP